MKHHRFLLLLFLLLPIAGWAQVQRRLSLPRLGQLSSQHVTQVMQDSEGFLWYATEGGGLCRDDGRGMTVFRSDAEHPDLLGSNDIACLAEASRRYIIIGTYHGAYVLDKQGGYSIHRLEEVDDKRVDDIIVGHNEHWWLTANKKIFEYSPDGHLLKTYTGGDKYIFRLHEDRQGRLWGAEWEGGLLRIVDGQVVAMRWTLDVAPTAIDDDPDEHEGLLIGTFGRGVVKYHTASETVEMTEPSDSFCMSRMTFYRKIQSTTGQKPTEFIRTIRLLHAAELLREGHMNITKVSYATGFSSVSYFSRCFRAMFGVTPTQFGKTTTEGQDLQSKKE